MRKGKYVKQVAVMLDEEFYKLLVEITDRDEISMSEYIREIVEKKLRKEK